MAAILFALNPFLVSGLTSLIKRIPAINNLPDGQYTVLLRFVVALLSFLGAVGVYMQTGDLDSNAVGVFVGVAVDTLMNFLGATGIHFLGKKN